MSLLPALELFIGLARDFVLEPEEGTVFDWSVWDDVEFSCLALGISKKLSAGAAALEIQAAGANVLVHLVGADLPATKLPGPYSYQMKVKEGTEWFDVAATGPIYLALPS